MFYHIFDYLEQFDFPGAGMFQYITFRSACAVILSLLIATVIGKRIIRILQKQQVGEEIRDLGLEGQMQKKGTPTMGGVIILLAILIPVILFARLDNVYIQLMIVSTIWLGLIGFLDDYIKVFKKHKEGLKGRFKVIGQVGLGLIVGVTLYASDDVLIREKASISEVGVVTSTVDEGFSRENGQTVLTKDIKSTKTTIPFFKNNEFDYAWFGALFGKYADEIGWIVFYYYHNRIVTASVERGESDRRVGRVGDRYFRDRGSLVGDIGVCLRKHGVCRLPEYHVYSSFWGVSGVYCCFYRGNDWFLVV